MGWIDGPTAISALRTLLWDNPNDKLASGKKVLGIVDGVNLTFKTFEYRRNTNFQSPTTPLGVAINGVLVDPALVLADDVSTGIFSLDASIAPTNRNSLTATYYYQWFMDSELDNFLQNASSWLGFGKEYWNIQDGLTAALLRFAGQEAYEMAAMKYSIRMSETYQLEDAPSEEILKAIEAFKSMANEFLAKAETMRNDFYTRQGQSLAPNFAFQLGKVIDPTPRR